MCVCERERERERERVCVCVKMFCAHFKNIVMVTCYG